MLNIESKILIGGKEAVYFPDLDLILRAKIDTGAKTSSLHATDIQTFKKQNQEWVSFTTKNEATGHANYVACEFPVHDRRQVRSSNGQAHCRYVIKTNIQLGKFQKEIQLTLADRSKMQYPMLLGRSAMVKHLLIAPGEAYLQGPPPLSASLENQCT